MRRSPYVDAQDLTTAAAHEYLYITLYEILLDALAAEHGVFGAPTFVFGQDMYFGNDRLDFLRLRLATAP